MQRRSNPGQFEPEDRPLMQILEGLTRAAELPEGMALV